MSDKDGSWIVALSDIHIGTDAPTCWYQSKVHEPYLIEVLDWVVANKHRIRELVLLGDVVDLWTYPFAATPPSFADILAHQPAIFAPSGALARVLDALDGHVTWVEGNHDMGITAADVASISSPGGHHVTLHDQLSYQPLTDDKRLLLAHGHEFTLFNAPDPESKWGGLPCGHFVTRAVAEHWSKNLAPGQTVADLSGQGAPNGLELSGLASSIADLDGTGVVSALFDYLSGALDVDEHANIVLATGETTTMAAARVAYEGRWRSWAAAAGGGAQGDIEAGRAAIADFTEELGWYAQKEAFATNAELVVLGHTHTPVADLDNSLVRYVNTGFECPASPDVASRPLTFAVIDTAEIEGHVWEVDNVDGVYSCRPADAQKEKITKWGTMDFSCYIEIDNSANAEALVLDHASIECGRFVNPPPERIEPHSVTRIWIQDDLGFRGSGGKVTYRAGERTVAIQVSCPTGLLPNRCYSTEPFRSRSSHGLWGNAGSVDPIGHPLFVKVAVPAPTGPAAPQPEKPHLMLSAPANSMASHYDVVVVGSGYGGAIAASRFARAGRSVCLLERGAEKWPGEYPETAMGAFRQTQLNTLKRRYGSAKALYDFHLDDEVNVLVGCGLGGTSLINANVALRPDSAVFNDERWPDSMRGRNAVALDPFFERAEAWLGSNPYPESSPWLAKLDALGDVAEALGAPLLRPPINVTFSSRQNLAGVTQPACNNCGNCVAGCNVGSKNTVLMNYLPDAVAHGASIFTERTVDTVRQSDNGRWEVRFRPTEGQRRRFRARDEFVTADIVVLAAGTVGSTEILLRSRDAGLATPARLGQRFSGNGDVLGFGYGSNRNTDAIGWAKGQTDPQVGPCITGVVPVTLPGAQPGDGLVIEEGAIPGILRSLLPAFLLLTAVIGSDAPFRKRLAMVFRSWRKAAAQTLTFLVMSDETTTGTLELKNNKAVVVWPEADDDADIISSNDLLNSVSSAIGAEYAPEPLWTEAMGHQLITVHPLGGCVMADDASTGVVNDRGEVFSGQTGTDTHRGLHVLDGAIIPRPVDTNPSLTISALAERATQLICEDRGWPLDLSPNDPSQLPINPSSSSGPGIRFTERMAGWIGLGAATFEEGVELGQADASPLSFVVTIDVPDLGALEKDPASVQHFNGTVEAPALSPSPLMITDSDFRLMERDGDRAEEWNMKYHMRLTSAAGTHFWLDGHKIIKTGPFWRGWKETTTLYTTVSDSEGTPIGRGILTISVRDLLKQLASMTPTNTGRFSRLGVKFRFAKAFTGNLLPLYGGVLDEDGRLAHKPMPPSRTVRLPDPEVAWFSPSSGWNDLEDDSLVHGALTASQLVDSTHADPILECVGDDAELLLTRYHGGQKGPVLLAAGFSMRANSYAQPTIDTTMAEALVEAGYDVWLFDYRASIALPSSLKEFTIDDIAKLDWPEAVAEVRRRTNADSVQVVGHCVGSVTILMAILAGLEGVRSAVCSQFALHPRTSLLNRAKNAFHVVDLFHVVGIKRLNPDSGRGPKGWAIDLAAGLLPIPKGESCQVPVCRWLNAVFGLTHTHAQLNAETHEAFTTTFGTGEVTPLRQLSKMTRKRKAVDHEGRNTYLPNVERLGLPLLFIQGSENYIFKPKGTAKTLSWLRKHHDPALFDLLYLDGYAHLDGIMGRNASVDVFPRVIAHLDAHPRLE